MILILFLAIIHAMPQNTPPNFDDIDVSPYQPDNLKMDKLAASQQGALNLLYSSFKSIFDVLNSPAISYNDIKNHLQQKFSHPWRVLDFSSSEKEVFLCNIKTQILANLSFKANSWDNKSADPDLRQQKYYQFSLYDPVRDNPNVLPPNIHSLSYKSLKLIFMDAYPAILLNPDHFTINKAQAPHLLQLLEKEASLHAEMNREQKDYVLGKVINGHTMHVLRFLVNDKKPYRFFVYAQELAFLSQMLGLGSNGFKALTQPSPEVQQVLKKSLFTENLMGHLYYCHNNIKNLTDINLYWDPIASKSIKSMRGYTVYETNSYGVAIEQIDPMNWKGYGFSWLSLYDSAQCLTEALESPAFSYKDMLLSFEIKDGQLIMVDNLFQECAELFFDSMIELYRKLNSANLSNSPASLTIDDCESLPMRSYEQILAWAQKSQLEISIPAILVEKEVKNKI